MTLSKKAQKDLGEFTPAQRKKIAIVLERMQDDPFFPPYEKLSLNLAGKYSRRINIQDRLVYEIREADGYKGEVYVIRMKGHYKGLYSIPFF